MVSKQDFKRIGEYLWEIPQKFREDMRVPARIYADDELLEAALGERSVEQLVNTTTLPGIVGYALAMPDIHQGYGFPIGGVAATRLPQGVISPGGVGYDINCGVRLLGMHVTRQEILPYVGDLATALYQNCPSGVGEKGSIKVSDAEFDELCVKGARWALGRGFARPEDLTRTEESGCLAGADPGPNARALDIQGFPALWTKLGSLEVKKSGPDSQIRFFSAFPLFLTSDLPVRPSRQTMKASDALSAAAIIAAITPRRASRQVCRESRGSSWRGR